MSDPMEKVLDEARQMIGVEPVRKEPPKRPDPRKSQKSIMTWHRPEVHRQLAVIAAEQGKTQRQLMTEALNLLFQVYQKPPIA
jgi:predicted HicB family RNase H-like nuclease